MPVPGEHELSCTERRRVYVSFLSMPASKYCTVIGYLVHVVRRRSRRGGNQLRGSLPRVLAAAFFGVPMLARLRGSRLEPSTELSYGVIMTEARGDCGVFGLDHWGAKILQELEVARKMNVE